MLARRIFPVLSVHRSLGRTGSRYPLPIALEDLVEVGQHEPEPDHLAVLLGERDDIRNDDRLELLREMIDLVVGHRDEAPVLLPRRVVELLDALDVALEVLHVERTKSDALALPDQLRAARESLGNRDVLLHAAALVDQEVLRLV